MRVMQDNETEQDANEPRNESVTFTTSKRVINGATLFFDDGTVPVKD